MEVKNGFYTAMGTPIDEHGDLIEDSFIKHIEQQIALGASGLLVLGSMGIEVYLKNSTIAKAAKIAADTVRGRIPLFIGAMDNSIVKVMEKRDAIGNVNIDGIVLTTPFYATLTDDEVVNWFTTIADKSPYPLYLYDIAVVTKTKIKMCAIDRLINHKNIKGIKTVDWEMIQAIGRKYPNADFNCLYSGLDNFDYANMMGIGKNLDGMFCCTPKNTKAMFDAIGKREFALARVHLDNILLMRNTMISLGLMRSFTYLMNELGFEGNFHQDYTLPLSEEIKKTLIATMTEIGEF